MGIRSDSVAVACLLLLGRPLLGQNGPSIFVFVGKPLDKAFLHETWPNANLVSLDRRGIRQGVETQLAQAHLPVIDEDGRAWVRLTDGTWGPALSQRATTIPDGTALLYISVMADEAGGKDLLFYYITVQFAKEMAYDGALDMMVQKALWTDHRSGFVGPGRMGTVSNDVIEKHVREMVSSFIAQYHGN